MDVQYQTCRLTLAKNAFLSLPSPPSQSLPSSSSRNCTGICTYRCTLMSQPEFLASIGYQIFLSMVLCTHLGAELCYELNMHSIGADPGFDERRWGLTVGMSPYGGSGSKLHQKILKMWIVKKGISTAFPTFSTSQIGCCNPLNPPLVVTDSVVNL